MYGHTILRRNIIMINYKVLAANKECKTNGELPVLAGNVCVMCLSTFPDISVWSHLMRVFLCLQVFITKIERERERVSSFRQDAKERYEGKRVNEDAVVKERRNAVRSQHQSETRWWVVWLQSSVHAECTDATRVQGLMVTAGVLRERQQDDSHLMFGLRNRSVLTAFLLDATFALCKISGPNGLSISLSALTAHLRFLLNTPCSHGRSLVSRSHFSPFFFFQIFNYCWIFYLR